MMAAHQPPPDDDVERRWRLFRALLAFIVNA
jgi:hypothetical protein